MLVVKINSSGSRTCGKVEKRPETPPVTGMNDQRPVLGIFLERIIHNLLKTLGEIL
jgi:hypothetical protein